MPLLTYTPLTTEATAEQKRAAELVARKVAADVVTAEYFVMELDDPTALDALKLGMAMYLDKPLVLILHPDQVVPANVRRAAFHIIEVEA
jgi:hypothetical protein